MCTHLQRRGNRYYIRRVIPLDLVPHYGRGEYTKALGTSDYGQAKALCRRVSVQLDEEFESTRQRQEASTANGHNAAQSIDVSFPMSTTRPEMRLYPKARALTQNPKYRRSAGAVI